MEKKNQTPAEWLRQLAEQAEAKLPREKRRRPGQTDAEWLRGLAEAAKADLDRRKHVDSS